MSLEQIFSESTSVTRSGTKADDRRLNTERRAQHGFGEKAVGAVQPFGPVLAFVTCVAFSVSWLSVIGDLPGGLWLSHVVAWGGLRVSLGLFVKFVGDAWGVGRKPKVAQGRGSGLERGYGFR